MKKIRMFIEHLKTKWNIKNNWDFILIMLAFSCAGMILGYERKPIFHFLGIDHMPLWFQIVIYLPICFPLYQLNLLVFGSLLGQFPFFWNKQKRFAQFVVRRFQPR